MRGTTSIGKGGDHSGEGVTTMVALEVLLLWPRGVDPSPATVDEAGLWPVFVLVVGERPDVRASSASVLFEMLDRPPRGGELAVVAGRCRWSVIDPRNALLKVMIRAETPERFAVDVLVPARPALGVLDVVARGATIGLTTARHVGRLTGRMDIRRALPEVVLLGCEPSTELEAIADLVD